MLKLLVCNALQAARPFASKTDGKMGYEDFVYFILSEEDKTNNISLDYWFKCIDLDCDGCLRANEMLVCVLTLCLMIRAPPVQPDFEACPGGAPFQVYVTLSAFLWPCAAMSCWIMSSDGTRLHLSAGAAMHVLGLQLRVQSSQHSVAEEGPACCAVFL